MVTLPNVRRGMFLVGMFEFRGIYNRVVRSEKGEQDGDDDGKSDRDSQGRPNSTISKLDNVSQYG